MNQYNRKIEDMHLIDDMDDDTPSAVLHETDDMGNQTGPDTILEPPQIHLEITTNNDEESDGQKKLPKYTIISDRSSKSSSGVWKYFGYIQKDEEIVDKNLVYCVQCFAEGRSKRYQKSTSTGNLIKHLSTVHNITLIQTYRIKQEKNRLSVTRDDITNEQLDVPEIKTEITPVNSKSKIFYHVSDSEEYVVHDINEILINEVAKRPELYDISLIQKRGNGTKANIRQQLWNEIYVILNGLIPLDKLPKIWKNIRDRYQKIKREISRGTRSIPKYRYFKMLKFLDNLETSVDDKSPKPEPKEDIRPIRLSDSATIYRVSLTNEGEEFNYINCHDDDDEDGVSNLPDSVDDMDKINIFGSDVVETSNRDSRLSSIMSHYYTEERIDDEDDDDQGEIMEEIIEPPPQKRSKPLNLDDTVTLRNQISTLDDFEQYEDINEILDDDEDVSGETSSIKNATSLKQGNEFELFGKFVAEVMQNMSKTKARQLQMKIMEYINEVDE